MHLFDTETRLLGGYGIVGGQLPLATGAALAVVVQGRRRGRHVPDGRRDDEHRRLPRVAEHRGPVESPGGLRRSSTTALGMGTTVEKSSAEPELYKRGAAYRMASAASTAPTWSPCGTPPRAAVERARGESSPYLLETISPRLRGHSVVDPARYRSKEEREALKAADPLATMALELEEAGVLSPRSATALDAEVKARGRGGRRRSPTQSPEPDVSTLFDYTYATPVAGRAPPAARRPRLPFLRSASMATMTYRQALRDTLRAEMLRDDERLPDGRGDRRLRGLVQDHRGAAQGVRRAARPRHPDRRGGLRRRGDRRGDARAAARSSRS